MQKIRKGDKVIVISGKDKGRTGVILKVITKTQKIIVENVNLVKRHQKQNQKHEGGIITKESPIHVSNVAMLDAKTNKPTRVGFVSENGKKLRVLKRSGEKIDV